MTSTGQPSAPSRPLAGWQVSFLAVLVGTVAGSGAVIVRARLSPGSTARAER